MKKSTIVISALLLGLTAPSKSAEVFFTDFEEAPNSSGFTTAPLDGWSTTDEAIEYWYHAAGNSSQPAFGNYIELNASSFFQSATDIVRTINTVAGVEYRLSFIYSGRAGWSQAYNSMDVRLDGTTLQSYSDNANSRSDHFWRTANITFTEGRGMRVDSIRLEFTSHDISVVKTDSKAGFQPGETSSYTITVTNNGPDDAQDIDIIDSLPNGVQLSGSWSCSAPAGSSCSAGSGGSAGDTSVSLTADIENGDAVTVTVPVVYSTDPSDY
jgi:uncharacterized repeat protein (TIGR01451 family)